MGPIFQKDQNWKSGWVNAYRDGYGWMYATREKAEKISEESLKKHNSRTLYRVRVRIKEQA